MSIVDRRASDPRGSGLYVRANREDDTREQQRDQRSVYTVRDAVGSDLDKIVRISQRVLKESPTYTHMQFDHEKVANWVCSAILKREGWFLRVIADDKNEPVGGIICICETSVFGPDKVAYDVTIMLDAEHRGRCTRQLVQTIYEYKVWALEQGAKVIKIGVSSGMNMDSASKFFERLGFARIGAMHGFIVGE